MVIAAMPPPVHGQSAVTEAIVTALLKSSCRTVVVDTSPGRLKRNWAYHTARARKHIVALTRVLWHSFRRSKRIYTVVESGSGIGYNFLVLLAARALGYELFLHHHTARHIKQRDKRAGFLLSLAGEDATHIVLSDSMAADLKKMYPNAKKTMTLHNARTIETASLGDLQHCHGELRLGLLSNLSTEKGLDTAISTCLSAVKAGLSAKLILAGPLADHAAEESVERIRDHEDLFEYRGPLFGKAKARFFQDLDVFLFPTHYPHEAQPLVVLEAMAVHVPVIATDQGYIRELVGDCGVIVPKGSDFAQTAVKILETWHKDPARFEGARIHCCERFERLFRDSENQFFDFLKAITTA